MDTRIDSFFVKKKNNVNSHAISSGSTSMEIEKSLEYDFVFRLDTVERRNQRYQKMLSSGLSITLIME